MPFRRSVTKPCARCPHSATMPRIRIAAFIARSDHRDDRRRARRRSSLDTRSRGDGCRHRPRQASRGCKRCAGGSSGADTSGLAKNLLPGSTVTPPSIAERASTIAVDVVGQREPDVVAALGNLERSRQAARAGARRPSRRGSARYVACTRSMCAVSRPPARNSAMMRCVSGHEPPSDLSWIMRAIMSGDAIAQPTRRPGAMSFENVPT